MVLGWGGLALRQINQGKIIQYESGFTLIEVICSLVIITVVIIAFSQILGVSMHNNYKLELKNKAINLAQAEMERLKALKTIAELEAEITDFVDAGNGYEKKIEVSDYNGINQLKEVTVIIRWQEKGTERFYSLSTLIYKSQ